MMTKNSIENLFSSFLSKQILILGDVMVDAYLFGKVERISPEAPVPVVSVNSRETRPGGAANVALNIKSLGAEPILCSVVGNDTKGNEFIESLEKFGLSTKGIIKSNDRITTTKFRIIGNKVQMMRVDEEITDNLSQDDFINLYDTIEHILENEEIDAVIFEDYDKGVISKELIEKIIFKTRILDIPVIVDPKKRNFLSYNKATVFKPNLKELVEGTHYDYEAGEELGLKKVIEQFIRQHELDILITTMSEKGILVSWQENGLRIINHKMLPAHVRNISDVSGAGDTVVGVVALCYAAGLSPCDIASIANIAGGLVCEEVGVVPINKNKLYQEIKRIYNV